MLTRWDRVTHICVAKLGNHWRAASSLYWLIEAQTKWPTFCRRHFQTHFLWMKYAPGNLVLVFQIMVCRLFGIKPECGPITETEMSSFWWNFHHWLHWKLSKWQLPVQPVMKISSKWRHFRFSDADLLHVNRSPGTKLQWNVKQNGFHSRQCTLKSSAKCRTFFLDLSVLASSLLLVLITRALRHSYVLCELACSTALNNSASLHLKCGDISWVLVGHFEWRHLVNNNKKTHRGRKTCAS